MNTLLTIEFPDMETWKPILNHPNYEVSNEGRVRSLPHSTECLFVKTGRIHTRYYAGLLLHPSVNNDGYLYVSIDGERISIHRLVAESFIGKPKNLEIDHIDGDKLNNKPENLRWVTHRENIIAPLRMAKFIKSKTGMKYNKK